MAQEVQSDEWLRRSRLLAHKPAANGPDLGPMNIFVSRDGGQDVQVHLFGRAMSRGLDEGAATTVSAPYGVSRSLIVNRGSR